MLRILYLIPSTPWPFNRSGGAQRSELLWRALRRHGQVDTLLVCCETEPQATDEEWAAMQSDFGIVARFDVPRDRRTGFWKLVAGLPLGPIQRLAGLLAGQQGAYSPVSETAQWIRQRVAERRYDLIVVRYLRTAMCAGCVDHLGVPVFLDFDDVDWRKMASKLEISPWAGLKGKIAAVVVYQHLKMLCRRAIRHCQHLWFTNEDDLRATGIQAASVLPNIPHAPQGAPELTPCPASRDNFEIAFIGHLGYEPNIYGLEHFLRSVWPRVRAAEPRAILRIVGKGMAPEAASRWSVFEGVHVVGEVPDVAPVYARCAVTISPVYYGGGTKIKVLESMAYARACIVTPHVLDGYNTTLKHRESVWCGSNDEEFAEGCVRLLQDADLREAIAQCGREIVQREYSWTRFEAVVDAALDKVHVPIASDVRKLASTCASGCA